MRTGGANRFEQPRVGRSVSVGQGRVVPDRPLRRRFDRFFATPQLTAIDRMQRFRLAWDPVGPASA